MRWTSLNRVQVFFPDQKNDFQQDSEVLHGRSEELICFKDLICPQGGKPEFLKSLASHCLCC